MFNIQRYFWVIYITQNFYTRNSFSAASNHDVCSNSSGVNDKLPHSSFLSDNLWLNQCVQLLENYNIHYRYWKYFPPAHSSGNNVLNVPNLSMLGMYALIHVLCFCFLFLTSDIAMAAPTIANSSEVHATTSTSSSAILT